MADIKYVDYAGLQKYHGLITGVISAGDAASIKCIKFNEATDQIEFYKDAAGKGTPDYTVGIAGADVSSLKTVVGTGTVNAYNSASTLLAIMNILTGGEDVAGSIAAIAKAAAKDAVEALDVTDEVVENQFVTAVSEEDGKITVSRATLTADNIPSLTLAKISDKGTAASATVAIVDIGAESEDTAALPTVEQIKTYVASQTAALAGAVHFRGIVESTEAVTEPKSGDMCIVGVKEYIYNGTDWQELGDEGAYVAKITGKSLVDDTEITKLSNIAAGAQVNVIDNVSTDFTIAEDGKTLSVASGKQLPTTEQLEKLDDIGAIPLTGKDSIEALFNN